MHRTQTSPATRSPAPPTRLHAFFAQHRARDKAAREDRMGASQQSGVSVRLSDQHPGLTGLREAPEFRHYALTCPRSALCT